MKQTLTNDEWALIEARLNSPYQPVALLCDGFHVQFNLVQIQMRLVICFVVNGTYLGKWMVEDCEERRRFHRPVRKFVYSAKNRETMKKMSKRQLKRLNVDPTETYTAYAPWWTSFKSLRAHLQKNNERIEMLKDWRYEQHAVGE